MNSQDQKEMITEGSLHGASVFAVLFGAEAGVEQDSSGSVRQALGFPWKQAYLVSKWFGQIYLLYTSTEELVPPASGSTFRRAMDFRVDPDTSLLWIFHRGMYIPCVPEEKVLMVLRLIHDDCGHWGKQGTMAKLRGFAYWPNQSVDIEKYIRGCIHCARHGPATKSQLLHPVRIQRPFQLLGIDFIGPLPESTRGFKFILHILDYFSRFSITVPTKTANASDVVPALEKTFTLYATSLAMYADSGQHFDNKETKNFLQSKGVSLTFSPYGSSQSTGMVEIGNQLLEDVLRKKEEDWELILNACTRILNSRIIGHLGLPAATILLGVNAVPNTIDSTIRSVPSLSVHAWVQELLDPSSHETLVRQYILHRSQLHDVIWQRSDRKKDEEARRFNRGISEQRFMDGELVMIWQKSTGKLEPRWRGPFMISGYGGVFGKSYTLKQYNGRGIRGHFHGNHLKKFVPQEGHLADRSFVPPPTQTIRPPRKKKKKG